MRHHLALAACLVLSGSIAHAAPGNHGRHGKVSKKSKHRAATETRATARLGGTAPERRTARAHDEADSDSDADNDRVAFAEDDELDTAAPDDGEEIVDAPVTLHRHAAPRGKDWSVAVGPYLWASSVDANVSLGPASVSAGVDFVQMERHARYGAEVLAEARYGRFSISGDLMYGVVAVDGQTTVGPLMVTLNGNASSVLVDGAAGYLVTGGEHSLLSLEARGGVRYQRTAVTASVGVAGADVGPPESVDAGADAVAGARVFLRPSSRFFLSGSADVGVFGASNSTWSASADASVRVTSHLQLSLGYRTLTIDRANVAITMHGPRAAVQLLF